MPKKSQKHHSLKPLPHKRCRGGQPGNINALKHGLYSPRRETRANGSSNNQRTNKDVLAKEIADLREIFSDLVEHYHNIQDMDTRLAIADRVALFSSRICQLARSQHFISPPEDPFLAELDAAGQSVTAGWKLMDRLHPSRKNPPAPDPGEPHIPENDHPPPP
jgi:hypothetical protein